jgi:polysaccharide biosynthesis protein PslG
LSSRPSHNHAPEAAHETPRRSSYVTPTPVDSLLRIALAVGILMTVWSVARMQPWNPVAAAGDYHEPAMQWTRVNPIGVNTFLAGEVEVWKRERTIEMVAESGAGWIRQGFAWNEIEPQPGEYWDARYQQDSWAKYDNIVSLAEKHGVRIIARLDQTPAWARAPGSDPATPPTDFADFGNFVYEFVSRYEGRISFIQIWNEPNLAREWGGAIDPAGYASLLEIASTRAREANPHVVILSAPMAMTTENSARAADEFTYWQALYDLGVHQSFDIMSANVYGLSDRYDAEPDASVLNTRRVELLRDLAVRNGDGHKAIWFNEYGWNAAPADFPAEELIWSRVDEATQAEWTAAGFEYAAENWEWFGVGNIWYFRHVGNISVHDADYYFRMVDVEFTPRDVYRSVQRLGRSRSVAGVGIYGVLEEPVSAFGSWKIVRDTGNRDGYSIAGGTGSSIHVRFEGSVVDLHIPPETSAGEVSVTVHPGHDSRQGGTRPLRLSIPETGGFLTITSDLISNPDSGRPQTRTAVITIMEDSILEIDAMRVNYNRSYGNVLASGAMTAVAFIAMVGFRRWGERRA